MEPWNRAQASYLISLTRTVFRLALEFDDESLDALVSAGFAVRHGVTDQPSKYDRIEITDFGRERVTELGRNSIGADHKTRPRK